MTTHLPRGDARGDPRGAAARRARLPHGRGRRPLRRLLRRQPRACSRSSGRSASATRRCRSPPSSARASARRWAACGPIVEIMTVNFSLLALDQIVNNAATLLHMSGGQFAVPARDPHDHRRRPPARRAALAQPRGLVRPHPRAAGRWRPATLEDARGMLWPALRDPDPVLIFEHGALYNIEGELADDAGAGRHRRGRDPPARRRRHARHLRRHPAHGAGRRRRSSRPTGIEAEVIDLRVLRPLDEATILASVAQDAPRRRRRRGLAQRQPRRRGQRPDHREARSTSSTRRCGRVCSAEVPIPYAAAPRGGGAAAVASGSSRPPRQAVHAGG